MAELQRVLTIKAFGGPEVLEVDRCEVPRPGTGQLLIKVEATGVCFPDVMIRRGVYPVRERPPFALGYDVVGSIVERGEGVPEGPEVGQRVAALTVIGAYAEFLCVEAAEAVPVPDGLGSPEAVSLVLNYTTAFQMLHRAFKARSGQRALVHGAAGGVGSALLQLGRLAGLELYGTASPTKLSTVEALGARPIDYRARPFDEAARELVPGGLDGVFEGFGVGWWPSYRLLTRGGTLVVYGMGDFTSRWQILPGMAWRLAMVAALSLVPDGRGVAFYSLPLEKKRDLGRFKADLASLMALAERGQIEPLIAEQMPLEEARRAHEMLENRAVSGKIVLLAA